MSTTKPTPTNIPELVADNRKWVQLHQENKYQREAAKRMTRVLDALEREYHRAENGARSARILARGAHAAAQRAETAEAEVLTFREQYIPRLTRAEAAIREAYEARPSLGDSSWRGVDRMIGILSRALDGHGAPDDAG